MFYPFSVGMLLNKLIIRGLKFKMLHTLWLILIELKFRLATNPSGVLLTLLIKYSPWFRLLPKHLSGKKYWIPVKINYYRSTREFWKLLTKCAKQRLEPTFYLRVLGEIWDTYNSRSNTLRLIDERYTLVHENRQNYRLLFKFRRFR